MTGTESNEEREHLFQMPSPSWSMIVAAMLIVAAAKVYVRYRELRRWLT